MPRQNNEDKKYKSLPLYICHVIIPIFIGGTIYFFFRSPKPLMFKWIHLFQMSNGFDKIRHLTFTTNLQIPTWMIFSFPDALWEYSLTAFMIITWKESLISSAAIFWMSLCPVLGIALELGQKIGIIKGTFDLVDLLFIIIASILPFFNLKKYFIRRYQQ